MKLKKGQQIELKGIRMTLWEIKDTFRGKIYHFIYWNGGNLIGIDFNMNELRALGAIFLVDNAKKFLDIDDD